MVMDTLDTRYEDLLRRSDKIEAQYDLLQQTEVRLQGKIEDLEAEILLQEKVSELFKHLLERYVHEYAESFSALVTEGLQAIYHDQDVRFKIQVEQKRGKVYATFVTRQKGRDGDPLESFGGGVAAVQSLILRILVVLKQDLAKYLFLDESLAALSSEYVDTCGEFLRKFCERMGVHVLLVTHNPGFLDHATLAYKGTLNSKGRLRLTEVRE